MNNTEFAVKIMQEVGLEINSDNYVIDQDTGDKLNFKGRNVKFNANGNVPLSREDILFDPLDNQTMMSQIFSYFTNKLDEQDGRYINVIYSTQPDRYSKGTVSCKENGRIIQSNEYYKDSLKYANLITKLNGAEEDFSDLDAAPVIPKTKKRG